MAYEFKLPDLGEGVVEGEIVKWLVNEGDDVAEDQPLVEIMTDKATVNIPSPRAGTVSALNGSEGDTVSVGDTLVVLDTGDGAAPAAKPEKKKKAKKNGKSAKTKTAEAAPPKPRGNGAAIDTPPARLSGGLPARTTSPLAGQVRPLARESGGGRPVRAAPSVRRRAREMGVDLGGISGSGAGGRITAEDLGRARERPAPGPETRAPRPDGPPYNLPPGVTAPGRGEEVRVPLKGVRRAISRHMQKSKNTAAHFTFVEEVDMRKLVSLREELKAPAAARGVKITYLPFFVKAAVTALMRHPQLNVTLDEETEEVVYQGWYHVGVAAATDRGLLVPVVKNADQRSLLEIATEIDRLAAAARDGSIALDEMQGSTFTITSLGLQGGLFATPVINFPEVAIMGIHQIKDRPIVENGQIVPGKVMLLSLSFDHRLVDGHVGAAFAYEVKDLLENPGRLMLEMG